MEDRKMDQDAFELLERRVGDAMAALARLRQEKAAWSLRRDELSSALAELESRNGELQSRLQQLQESSMPRAEYEQRKALIEKRVHQLLARFEELDATTGE
jgi:hypothetical protein